VLCGCATNPAQCGLWCFKHAACTGLHYMQLPDAARAPRLKAAEGEHTWRWACLLCEAGPGEQVVEAALADANLGVDDVDWLLLHQANQARLPSPRPDRASWACASAAAQRVRSAGDPLVAVSGHGQQRCTSHYVHTCMPQVLLEAQDRYASCSLWADPAPPTGRWTLVIRRPWQRGLCARAQRILDSAAQRLGVAPERVVSNLASYGNTSAASIPLALDEAVRSGAIAPGSTVPAPGDVSCLRALAAARCRWRSVLRRGMPLHASAHQAGRMTMQLATQHSNHEWAAVRCVLAAGTYKSNYS